MSTRAAKEFEMANKELATLVRTSVREELTTALAEGLKPIRDDLKKYMKKVNECDGKVRALDVSQCHRDQASKVGDGQPVFDQASC